MRNTRRKTIEQVKAQVDEITDSKYLVLSDTYTNNKTKLSFKHLECGNEFEMTPHDFINGNNRCPKCRGKRISDSSRCTLDEFKLKVPNGFEVVSDVYVNNKTKVTMRHISCGRMYEMTPNDVVSGHGCPRCKFNKLAKDKRLPLDTVRESIATLGNNEYEFVDEQYLNNYTPITIKHLVCGNIYTVRYREYQFGNRCPVCQSSKGETEVARILNNLEIPYRTQVRFSECKDKLPLPFDFEITVNDSVMLIEFDGIQHFKQTDKFGDLAEIQKRDKIKTQFCIHSRKPLLRIPYTEFSNIQKLITAFVS